MHCPPCLVAGVDETVKEDERNQKGKEERGERIMERRIGTVAVVAGTPQSTRDMNMGGGGRPGGSMGLQILGGWQGEGGLMVSLR